MLTGEAVFPVRDRLLFFGGDAGAFGCDGDVAQCGKFGQAERFVEVDAAAAFDGPDDRAERVDRSALQDNLFPVRRQPRSLEAGTFAGDIEKANGLASAERIDGCGEDHVSARVGSSPPMLGIVGAWRLAPVRLNGRHRNTIE